jgi:hypothetical protein
MISQQRYEFVKDHIEDIELDALWLYTEDDAKNFDERRAIFFFILKRLLEEGRVRLLKVCAGPEWPGSIDEQIERFGQIFPKDEATMEDGKWFYKACPVGSAWQH